MIIGSPPCQCTANVRNKISSRGVQYVVKGGIILSDIHPNRTDGLVNVNAFFKKVNIGSTADFYIFISAMTPILPNAP